MPVDWSNYPDNWKELAMTIKNEVDWVCEGCGKQCRRPGEPFDTHRRTLTVSHQDHDTKNNSRDNLKALCAPCHLRYDAKYKGEQMRLRNKRLKNKKNKKNKE